MAEALAALVRANVVAALAILAVLALRTPVRRAFGAEVAYGLWTAPLLAVAGSLLPARQGEATPPMLGALIPDELAPLALGLWAGGVALGAGLLALAQLSYLRRAKAGRAGPAVVGVICPRIVMPRGDDRYTAEERSLIRAHEREHVARGDPAGRAFMAAARCLAWCNPLVHWAARAATLDQELACDAAVLRKHGFPRAAYAQTLLKTQVGAAPPLGAHWPPAGRHPLETRIAALARRTTHEGGLGPALVCAAALAAGLSAWAAKPPVAPRAWISPAMVEAAGEPVMSVMLIRTPKRPELA